jgi:integrase
LRLENPKKRDTPRLPYAVEDLQTILDSPLHSALIEAGFLRYVDRRKASGQTWLFPDFTPDKDGKFSSSWSKWWGRYARDPAKIGIGDRNKVFHSTRHAFRDACVENRVAEPLIDALLGHEGGGIGRQVYGQYGKRPPLDILKEAIELVAYPGLRIPVICPG